MDFNLNKKLSDALRDIKTMEGQATERIKMGSQEPAHFLDMTYYSGVHNGFVFYKYVIDHIDTITEKDIDIMFAQMMQFEPLKVN